MINTFDEASKATEDMFAEEEQFTNTAAEQTPNEGQEEAVNPEQTADEQNGDIPTREMLEEAVNTAEVAAETATQANQELEMLRQQNAMLQGQNQQLQGTIDELSRQNQQNIIEEALEPPTLNINDLSFADEETMKAVQAEYASKMAEYTKRQMMKELSPALEFAKEGLREKEKSEVISALSQIPELTGITEMMPQLDRIIDNNKWLQSDDMAMDERYINAFAMARGVNSINTPPPAPPSEPTTDELMELYNKNPEFRELIEKQRLEQIKQSQQVPPFSASSGAVNAALDIKEKPKTMEEASQRTREMFGAM